MCEKPANDTCAGSCVPRTCAAWGASARASAKRHARESASLLGRPKKEDLAQERVQDVSGFKVCVRAPTCLLLPSLP